MPLYRRQVIPTFYPMVVNAPNGGDADTPFPKDFRNGRHAQSG